MIIACLMMGCVALTLLRSYVLLPNPERISSAQHRFPALVLYVLDIIMIYFSGRAFINWLVESGMLEQGEHYSVQNRVCIRVHSMIRVRVTFGGKTFFDTLLLKTHCMVILVILLDLKDRFEKM